MADNTSTKPEWKLLLSAKRIGRQKAAGYADPYRDDFERDIDRIIFSSAFRRLKDKTQVFPLSRNDFTRTRLTHSIEVSCVGRSLGRIVQSKLRENGRFNDALPNLATIVSAACLAHDIGNPPFGHSGEAAIQEWAKKNVTLRNSINSAANPATKSFVVDSEQQLTDLYEFEGNAQALRVLCRVQNRRRNGGLQLTMATIGAMMKYPCGSFLNSELRDRKKVEQKKFGYFEDEALLITSELEQLGLIEYCGGAFYRHPLAFLTEAADDICYAIIDLEDAVDQKLVSIEQATELFAPLADRTKKNVSRKEGYKGRARMEWLRAYAMQALVTECADVFAANVESILAGCFHDSLINKSEVASCYDLIREEVKRTAYVDSRVLEVEAAGFRVIGGLLDFFVPAIVSHGTTESKEHKKLLSLFPKSFLEPKLDDSGEASVTGIEQLSTYQKILAVTDYVSGMTDSFAVDLFQKLSGIRLPE
jgi:dGTPase